jgi:hypothetical protein
MTVENGTPKVATISRQLLPSARSRRAWSRLNTRRGLPQGVCHARGRTNARYNALPAKTSENNSAMRVRACRISLHICREPPLWQKLATFGGTLA